MPSGRTHDTITLLFAIPAAVGAYMATGRMAAAVTVGAAFVFGGLMFGPDLDTVSRQYSRWWVFRFLWLPYRTFFKHRSRFSHGLIFGALLRVIYFLGALSVVGVAAISVYATYRGGKVPGAAEFTHTWRATGNAVRSGLGDNIFILSFLGLWLGAASHTLTDMAGSFVKTGRVSDLL